MAAWQYDILVLPRKTLGDIFGKVPAVLDRETLESVDWWKGVRAPDFQAALSPLLERGESWNPDILTWGQEDGDRVDVLAVDGMVSECFVRIDMRKLAEGALARLLDLVRGWDCVLLTPDLRVVEPTLEAMSPAIRRSTAWAFVSDPDAFFHGLRRRKS